MLFTLCKAQLHVKITRTALTLTAIAQLVVPVLNIHNHIHIPFENILKRSSVGSCACEFTVLFSVVFYLVIPEHKSDFSFVIN
jgi:hypothetical protein